MNGADWAIATRFACAAAVVAAANGSDAMLIVGAGTAVVAGLSDIADGRLARRAGISSVKGAYLDLLADKTYALTALVVLTAIGRLHIIIVVFFVWRELLAVVTRAFAEHRGDTLPKDPVGVAKTVAQYVGCGVAFIWVPGGTVILVVAALLGVVTAAKYVTWWRSIA